MDLISRVGVVMGLWWGGADRCWPYFGISIQRLVILFLGDWIRPEVEISKSALLSLNDNNLSNTEAIVTK